MHILCSAGVGLMQETLPKALREQRGCEILNSGARYGLACDSGWHESYRNFSTQPYQRVLCMDETCRWPPGAVLWARQKTGTLPECCCASRAAAPLSEPLLRPALHCLPRLHANHCGGGRQWQYDTACAQRQKPSENTGYRNVLQLT